MPNRIQRKRTAGWRMPEGVIYVGRPTEFSNPYKVGTPAAPTPEAAVELFKEHLNRWPDMVDDIKEKLRGKDLACWCSLDKPCHADVLLEIANEGVKCKS